MKKDSKYFPYPHKFETTHSIKEVVAEFTEKCKENGVFSEDVVSVAGRVLSMRPSGKSLIFIDLIADAVKI